MVKSNILNHPDASAKKGRPARRTFNINTHPKGAASRGLIFIVVVCNRMLLTIGAKVLRSVKVAQRTWLVERTHITSKSVK